MPLNPGSQLGPYEILSPAGAGGMGEVYRARDTRLGRDVAVKVLPPHLASSPDLRARLDREAKAISSLQHSNICTLFDIGHQDGLDFLVMEFLEGETLAERLKKGPLPTDQLLRIAIEIADALDKAHRQGIIHRDLKPGNVMLTRSGAKLMDFGLAKPAALGAAAPSGTSLPAFTAALTQSSPASPITVAGTVVGTFQYMSPEQIEGREADPRSDIFAFGALLYEMATGKRAFEGKSQLSVASAILEKDPERISVLQPTSPPALEHLIERALAKDPDDRWQSARDVKAQLDWIATAGSKAGAPIATVHRRKLRQWLVWGVAALAVFSAIALGLRVYRLDAELAEKSRVVRSSLVLPPGSILQPIAAMSLSPDGQHIAYIARQDDSKHAVWVRALSSLVAQRLVGTDNANFVAWSADGRSLFFHADNKLKKIDAAGGPAQTLASVTDFRGATANRFGDVLFAASTNTAIDRVPASGGPITAVTTLDPQQQETNHRWPYFLPDGRHFVYLALRSNREEHAIMLGSLDSPERTLLVKADSMPAYAEPGYLLFVRERTLIAQRLNLRQRRLEGDPVPIVENIAFNPGNRRAAFAVSGNGRLLYHSGLGSFGSRMQLLDRAGKPLRDVGTPALLSAPRLSPDQKRVSAFMFDTQTANGDIWIFELNRDVQTRFTFDAALDVAPLWSPDGRLLAFSSNRGGRGMQLYAKPATGAGQETLLFESEGEKMAGGWMPDGRSLLFSWINPQSGKSDLWTLSLEGEPKPSPFLQSEFSKRWPTVSPDGKWVAYQSDESGTDEVYIAPFPQMRAKWQVSTGGGTHPRWTKKGREVVYMGAGDNMMAASVTPRGDALEIGQSQRLFEARVNVGPGHPYDVAPDGSRFVVVLAGEGSAVPFTLVLNWYKERPH